jgi:hypothetical protein
VAGGVSIIVNGQVVISQWTDGPNRAPQGSLSLTAGVKVPLEVDYFTDGANPAGDHVQLAWQSPSQSLQTIPRQYFFTGAALQPTPTPQVSSGCQASAVVDGQLGDWAWSGGDWSAANKIVSGNGYGAEAQFKTLWDNTNLYLGVTVTDGQLTNTGTGLVWENSAVELYLDTANSQAVTTTSADFEYFFRWNDTVPVENLGRTAGVSMKTTATATGYLLEASIPWSTLGLSAPQPGWALGMDLALDVNHNGGNCRDGQLMWNGNSDDYANPSGYGKLSLAAACPTPIETPPAPVGGLPYVSPNPTQGGSVKFTYTMAEAGTAHIKVWNAWGNLAASLVDPKAAGLESSQLDVTAFAPGHYFYRVELDYGSGRRDVFKTQVMAVEK